MTPVLAWARSIGPYELAQSIAPPHFADRGWRNQLRRYIIWLWDRSFAALVLKREFHFYAVSKLFAGLDVDVLLNDARDADVSYCS